MNYTRAADINDAIKALASAPQLIIAGGTDFYPARVGKPLNEAILDIGGLTELRGITDNADHYRIGALTTWSDLLAAALPACFDGLKLAAREIGGAQVQNAGTLCGNICNASPAADGIPNLLTLEAQVELCSAQGRRTLPLNEFIVGNRQTQRRSDELMTAIVVPKASANARSDFLKLGARKYLVISIVMVAGVLIPAADNTVADIRISVGACSPVAQRLPALEAALRGKPIGPELAALVSPSQLMLLKPISDIRASAAYRHDAALTLLRRTILRLTGEHA